MYFGPFAVAPRCKGQGLGRALLDEVERLSRLRGISEIEIRVVNHRSDLFPMYEKLGYDYCGESPYPKPEILTRPSHFLVMRKKLT
jgi:GNAT superfamily N-acetyltransferase